MEQPIESPVEPPPPRPALVLERWNSWARVFFPDTQEWTWVDLAEVPFEPAAGEPVD